MSKITVTHQKIHDQMEGSKLTALFTETAGLPKDILLTYYQGPTVRTMQHPDVVAKESI